MQIEETQTSAGFQLRGAESTPTEQQLTSRDAANEVLTLHAEKSDTAITCDLTDPIWSVVCFDGIEAGGLTYLQATRLMAELDAVGVVGLCIVTDTAAKRVA